MKVLLLAYHVSPYRGSECSVAWNHITNMAKYHELTVLYGSSGDHLGDDDDMTLFKKKCTLNNVTWVRVEPSNLAKLLNTLNRKNVLSYSFYLAYKVWHKNVFDFVSKNIDLDDFDLVHYLTPIGYREPGYLWKLGLPYIWGAIGGANNPDYRLVKALPLLGRIKYLFRVIVNSYQLRFSTRLKQALLNTDQLITATSENQKAFKYYHNKDSIYIPENGTTGSYIKGKSTVIGDKVNLIWIGSLDHGKCLKLLIDSFHYIKDPECFSVDIFGGGPLFNYLKKLVVDKGLGDVFTFHGVVSRDDVLNSLRNANLNVITSISEGNPTTIWESMQNGVPTLTIDHCGMRDTIKNNSGIKIPIDNYEVMAQSIAKELDKVANDPDILKGLSNGLVAEFRNYHWDNRVHFFNELYSRIVKENSH